MENENANAPLEPRVPTFVVDLMKRACGIEYSEASPDIEWIEVRDLVIPFANARLLLRTKQTQREKDALDRAFLAQLLKQKSP
jgi:hypothetical protein